MRGYVLNQRLVFEPGQRFDACHAEMFHGLVDTRFERDDNNLGDPLIRPLHLRKNVSRLAPIMKPSRNLVVSEAIRSTLTSFRNIAFFEVAFSCLFTLD